MFPVATVQAVAVVSLSAAWAWTEPATGLAAVYGGAGALVNTGLLFWRLNRGERDYRSDPGQHLRSFYRSSLERFFVVGVWLAVGVGGFRLAALPLLAGFVVGLLAWVIALAAWKERGQ